MRRSFEEKILQMRDLLLVTQAEKEQLFWQNLDGRVLAFGVYDMLHVGHIYYLQAARGLGNKLIVGVDSDVRVRLSKGPARPIFKQDERLAMIAALECVNRALVFDDMKQLIDAVSPNIMVTSPVGTEDPMFDKVAYAKECGIKVESIPSRFDLHTSDYITRILQIGRRE